MDSEVPTYKGARPEIDAEIDAFAENAFDALMSDDITPAAVIEAKTAEVDEIEIEDLDMDMVMVVGDSEIPGISVDVSVVPIGFPEPMQPDHSEELIALRAEVAELKVAASKVGGVSSREFLDLRESLNKKDKEILELREDFGARDKENLSLREQNLELERKQADFDEQVTLLQVQLSQANDTVSTLTEDKAASSKRFEDQKARAVRAEDKVRGLEEELSTERTGRSAEMASLRDANTQALDELKVSHQSVLESALTDHATALARVQEDQQTALEEATRNQELVVEQQRQVQALALQEANESHQAMLQMKEQEAMAAREAALEELTASLNAEIANKAAAAEAEWQGRFDELKSQLELQNQQAQQELEGEHSQQLATLGRKLADAETAMNTLTEQHDEATQRALSVEATLQEKSSLLESVQASNEELQRTHQNLVETHQETQGERDRLRSEIDDKVQAAAAARAANKELESRVGSLVVVQSQLEAKLSGAMEKMANDEAILQRVRKAMTIGLGLLEDQQSNALEDSIIEDAE